MKKILISIVITELLFLSFLFSKSFYVITLKKGTKIKADGVVKQDGYIKVFKFGGYFIYPLKNIKSIKYVKDNSGIENIKDNSSNAKQEECVLDVEKLKADPFFNPKDEKFYIKISGEIVNNCPVEFKNIVLHIDFVDKDNNIIASKKIKYDSISPYQKIKINKIFSDIDTYLVKYYKYKVEYVRVK